MSRDSSNLHELPKGWEWSKIGRLYKVSYGGTPSTKIEEYWEGDIPWITTADIKGLKNIRVRRKITQEAIRKSATHLVPERSIIIGTRVQIGKIAMTDKPLCFNQDCHALLPDESLVYPEFALYYLHSISHLLKAKGRGSVIMGVTKKDLLDLPLPLAPMEEQKQVGDKLDKVFVQLANLKVLLKRTLEHSDKLSQAILKQSFSRGFVNKELNDFVEEKFEGLFSERIKQEKEKLWSKELNLGKK